MYSCTVCTQVYIHQLIALPASSQPLGQLGRLVADPEGELGPRGEAGLVHGAVGSMVRGWGVNELGALEASFNLASVSANAGSKQQDFQASFKPLGQSGSLVSGEPVGEFCFWVEDTVGVTTRGVGHWGLG